VTHVNRRAIIRTTRIWLRNNPKVRPVTWALPDITTFGVGVRR
jgi:hypothetical protein